MFSIKEYTEAYNRWTKMLRENAERIRDSSESRKRILFGLQGAPTEDLLLESARCIYDLTGDEVFFNQVQAEVKRRKGK